jgi:hypothetical protein
MNRYQYGPLIINLGGDSRTNTVIPPPEDITFNVGGDDPGETETVRGIYAMTGMFTDFGGDFGAVYYYNLKPVSLAESEPFLEIPSSPGTKLTQAEYMSVTSRAVFGRDVVCSDGRHLKDW